MTDSGEINEPIEARRDRPLRIRWLALLVTALLAATAVVAFSAGSASAQTQNDGSDSSQQQADGTTTDDTCDSDGTRLGGKLGRFGMGDTLTELLGIDAETLRIKLKGGSTLADIATEQGVEVSDVVDALVTAVSEKADEHDREIDTDELTDRVAALVNGDRPERPEGEHGRHGRRGLHRGGKGIFGSALTA